AVEIKIPAVGESITEVTLAQWLKEDGDYVEMDENIAELESDKATFELPAEKAGILKIIAQEGDTLEIGEVVCAIEEGEAPASDSKPDAKKTESASESTTQDESTAENYASGTASPAAAKILREKGIDPATVKGTGKDGRITKADAENAEIKTPEKATPQKETATPTKDEAPQAFSRGERREKMSSLRRTIAKRLVTVKNETAMLTTFNEVNMQPIMDLRGKYKEIFKEKHGVGLGFMSFFTIAITTALNTVHAL